MGCAFAGSCESGRKSDRIASALDWRIVRQRRLTSSFRWVNPAQEPADPLLRRFPAPEAQIACSLFPGPPPDGDISVEVRAVPRQIHQLQFQIRCPQVFPQRLPKMGWRRPKSPSRAQDAFLSVASGRQPRCPSCCCHPVPSIPPPPSPSIPLSRVGLLPVAGTGGLHQGRFSLLHPLPPQLRVSARKWASSARNIRAPAPWDSSHIAAYSATKAARFSSSSLQQPFLGPLESKSQPVQPGQATAAAQAGAKAFQDKLPYRLPIPVGQFQARRRWRLLHRRLQLLLFRWSRVGEPPVVLENQCPGTSLTGPMPRRPMV